MSTWICIPSYNRAEKQLTLNYLTEIGIPPENLIISVQDEEDYKKYSNLYGKLVNKIVFRKAHNAAENRNTGLDATKYGDKIVLMDDDIKNVGRLVKGKLNPIETASEFWQFIDAGFALAKKLHTIAFGVYPVYNAFFMSAKYTKKTICTGTLIGIINCGERFNEKYNTKEDYALSCEIIKKYGAMPRLDNIACNAQHYTKGGCEKYWKNESGKLKDAAKLITQYSDIVRPNKKKPGEVLMVKEGKTK